MTSILATKSKVKIGDLFSDLEVIGPVFYIRDNKGNRRPKSVCRCVCGNHCVSGASDLLSGRIKSCGCIRLGDRNPNYKHGYGIRSYGKKLEPLYRVWMGMKNRCSNPNHDAYRHYGGRGIAVCDEWVNDYLAFRGWCLANGYQTGLQLDRRNNDDGYSPENCRFVTTAENSRNRRTTVFITALGETKSLTAWANDPRCVVGSTSLMGRLRRGMNPDAAITSTSGMLTK